MTVGLETEIAKRVLDVTIVMFDDGLSSTAVMPTEIFHSAGSLWNALNGEAEHPAFRVHTVSIGGAPVRTPYGFAMTPDGPLEAVEHSDIVIIPTSGLDLDLKLIQHSAMLPWLRRLYMRGAYVVGVCMGAAYLAAAGLLDGRLATTHWAASADMAARFPKVRWHPELFMTEDQRVLCSGGVGASIDISLYLVEKFCGHDVAVQTAKALLLPMPRLMQSGYAVLPVSRAHDDAPIRRVEAYLQENFRADVSVQALADIALMGERTFARRFKAATGRLPAAYVQALRIEAAKTMLEHEIASVSVVCEAIGYSDIGFFRALFKRMTGMTPGQYRSQFASIAVRGHAPPALHATFSKAMLGAC
ncbi:GlxA family transcriptional regulator [Sphingomonas sp. MMS12-HWE2-04]|uniref:GlxA family transcriptional regulator n=1 Tax=Sphingomonas sp. MMS12-HWE2-04 TaxID=3234199 RepID=UPI00384D1D56